MRTGTRNNRGFSLIELIVVIAIMAVLTAFVTLSVSYLTGQKARECANNLSFALDSTRTSAIAKNGNAECYMELTLEGGDYYVAYYVPENALSHGTTVDDNGNAVFNQAAYVQTEKERIGDGRVDILFSGDAAGDVTMSADTALRIFYKKDGAFSKFVQVSRAGDNENLQEINVTKITIDYGKTYGIQVYMLTGKHVMNVE